MHVNAISNNNLCKNIAFLKVYEYLIETKVITISTPKCCYYSVRTSIRLLTLRMILKVNLNIGKCTIAAKLDVIPTL